MSTSFRIGPFWPGWTGIKKLVIFGDSYSYVGYHSQASPPTAAKPLGLNHPGTPVTEPGQANWVGHLITSYNHGRSNILVYDYAVRGDTVLGVTAQISNQFLPTVGRRPQWAAWRPEDTLFITWIGVNDCRTMITVTMDGIVAAIANLFAAQEQLYRAGARNFLFVDVPPVDRSPAGANAAGDYSLRFKVWNEQLRKAMHDFTAAHADATVLLFSSWNTFTRVLDNPAAYGLNPHDVRTQGGSIWFDYMHPSSRFLKIIAYDIANLLIQSGQ
ncbi:SGNH hydrolase-type esterase domain-containing protein [Amylostereum chailletii]|nr:SGNH hydrolase-type esterase domain-containing protein [Amylostereum chailletii]